MTQDLLEKTLKSFSMTKSELFEAESPSWIADEFIIQKETFKSGLPGTVEIYPLDELCSIDHYTGMVLENKEKHEAIGMIIYREAIV